MNIEYRYDVLLCTGTDTTAVIFNLCFLTFPNPVIGPFQTLLFVLPSPVTGSFQTL